MQMQSPRSISIMQVRLPVFSAAMTMLPLPRRSGSGSSGSITFGQLISLQVQQLIKVISPGYRSGQRDYRGALPDGVSGRVGRASDRARS
jgi:hypothetical protein